MKPLDFYSGDMLWVLSRTRFRSPKPITRYIDLLQGESFDGAVGGTGDLG